MAQARRRFVLFVFLAVMLLEIPGVSADNTQATSLTIHAADENCSFSVYQIFTGSVSANALADIAVGMHFDLNKFNRSLLRDAVLSVELPEDFESFSTADEVAKFMESLKDDPDLITALANVLGKSLKSGADPLKIDTCEPAVNGYDYTLTGLTPGYYLVQEDIAASDNTKQYSRYILAVVGQAEINIKTTKAPTIKKSITVPEPGTSACAAIGETIQYELRSSVPDMTGYSSYSFVVVDTLSKGLAFQNDVEITLGDRTLSNKRDYTVTFQTNPDTGKTTVKIVFKNFYREYKNFEKQMIFIRYSAQLTAQANVGSQGNPNQVTLQYSNVPTYDYKDDFDDETPKGSTPPQETYVYTGSLQVEKVDQNGAHLSGAEFTLQGEGYTWQETVPESGILDFSGLSPGTYTLTEIKAPAGYSTLEAPITFELKCDLPKKSTDTCVWSVASSDGVEILGNSGVAYVRVVNRSGPQLPTTGGSGTLLFIGIGILMMLGVFVFWTARRRTEKT